MKNDASSVLFRRLPYMLSPQMDIYENLGPLVNGNVLEVGFGTGIGILQYAKYAKWVQATEIDPAAVDFAKRCFPLDNVAWVEADITKGGGETPDYDFVVMIEVLEHIADPENAMVNIRALLKPGGRALITVPNKNRDRKKDDPLIENEWDSRFFIALLAKYFNDVRLLDFEFHELDNSPLEITATPLIALCS